MIKQISSALPQLIHFPTCKAWIDYDANLLSAPLKRPQNVRDRMSCYRTKEYYALYAIKREIKSELVKLCWMHRILDRKGTELRRFEDSCNVKSSLGSVDIPY